MKNLLPTIALTAAAALALISPTAHAGSVNTYDLRGHGGLAKSHTFVHDDVTITATATSSKKKQAKESHVGQYRHGLGVSSKVQNFNLWGEQQTISLDAHTVDGKGFNETLWLSFDSPFQIAGAIFTYVGQSRDRVTVVDGDGNKLGRYNLSNIADCGVAVLDLSDLDYTGSKIGFAATGNHDSWKLAGVKGHAVPTPSAAAAGLLGLAALTARRRRRNLEITNA